METYQACETLLNKGLTKGISLNDYTIQDFEELLPYIKYLPNSNQMEVNPFVFRKASIEYFSERGIQIISHKPLGKGNYTQHPIILDVAQKLNLTPAQVLILWCLYHRLVIMTRSNDPCRIKENLVRDPILSENIINILDRLTTVENLLTWHNKYKNFT
jgi:diketogulonate reductase-like aldo/keto reductase